MERSEPVFEEIDEIECRDKSVLVALIGNLDYQDFVAKIEKRAF